MYKSFTLGHFYNIDMLLKHIHILIFYCKRLVNFNICL